MSEILSAEAIGEIVAVLRDAAHDLRLFHDWESRGGRSYPVGRLCSVDEIERTIEKLRGSVDEVAPRAVPFACEMEARIRALAKSADHATEERGKLHQRLGFMGDEIERVARRVDDLAKPVPVSDSSFGLEWCRSVERRLAALLSSVDTLAWRELAERVQASRVEQAEIKKRHGDTEVLLCEIGACISAWKKK